MDSEANSTTHNRVPATGAFSSHTQSQIDEVLAQMQEATDAETMVRLAEQLQALAVSPAPEYEERTFDDAQLPEWAIHDESDQESLDTFFNFDEEGGKRDKFAIPRGLSGLKSSTSQRSEGKKAKDAAAATKDVGAKTAQDVEAKLAADHKLSDSSKAASAAQRDAKPADTAATADRAAVADRASFAGTPAKDSLQASGQAKEKAEGKKPAGKHAHDKKTSGAQGLFGRRKKAGKDQDRKHAASKGKAYTISGAAVSADPAASAKAAPAEDAPLQPRQAVGEAGAAKHAARADANKPAAPKHAAGTDGAGSQGAARFGAPASSASAAETPAEEKPAAEKPAVQDCAKRSGGASRTPTLLDIPAIHPTDDQSDPARIDAAVSRVQEGAGSATAPGAIGADAAKEKAEIVLHKADFDRFRRIYQSRDGQLALYEDVDGTLTAVNTNNFV